MQSDIIDSDEVYCTHNSQKVLSQCGKRLLSMSKVADNAEHHSSCRSAQILVELLLPTVFDCSTLIAMHAMPAMVKDLDFQNQTEIRANVQLECKD